MSSARPGTPPRQPVGSEAKSPLTPEQIRRIEISRLKAKALREQREAEHTARNSKPSPPLQSRSSPSIAGQKRSFATFNSQTPATSRDAKKDQATADRPLDAIQPARNFAKYVEYDFSKMTDTKGGFLTVEDDPYNKALHKDERELKPANMTLKEWERQQLVRSLQSRKAGPFEPGINELKREDHNKQCRECGSLEIDWKWQETLKCVVCNGCKEKFPEKYSLLTKTEAKDDYLLTDRKLPGVPITFEHDQHTLAELKDENLLPHLERPNPHKSTWNNMMLYLRYQVEEYAFSERKWGSPEALDDEFTRRESDKKQRKESKFKSKLEDLKKRTRIEAWRRSRKGGNGGNFGDDLAGGKHVHEWSRPIENAETGVSVKTCVGCGMDVEELEF